MFRITVRDLLWLVTLLGLGCSSRSSQPGLNPQFENQAQEIERRGQVAAQLLQDQETSVQRAKSLLSEQEQQLMRMDKLLDKMDEQARRKDEILSAEERQLGIRRKGSD